MKRPRRKVLLSLAWFDAAAVHDAPSLARAVGLHEGQGEQLPAIHAQVSALLAMQRDPDIGLKDFAGL